MRYSDCKKHIKTGDIILWSGKMPHSRLIRWLTKSKWSHVGVAIWWGPIWGIALFDADDGGELLFTSPCVIPKVVGANDQLAFAGGTPNTAYGAIQITLE